MIVKKSGVHAYLPLLDMQGNIMGFWIGQPDAYGGLTGQLLVYSALLDERQKAKAQVRIMGLYKRQDNTKSALELYEGKRYTFVGGTFIIFNDATEEFDAIVTRGNPRRWWHFLWK